MILSEDHIEHVADRTHTPDPGADVHWYRIDLGDQDKPGWVAVNDRGGPPTTAWIAAKLSETLLHEPDQTIKYRLRAPGGLRL